MKINSENGSVSLFVLIAMIFFSIYTIAIYISISNSQVIQIKSNEQIREIYEKDIENVEQIYLELVD